MCKGMMFRNHLDYLFKFASIAANFLVFYIEASEE